MALVIEEAPSVVKMTVVVPGRAMSSSMNLISSVALFLEVTDSHDQVPQLPLAVNEVHGEGQV
jgi:hypothetical protein